ncbi:hypothetical protein [Streptomyces chartreusis]|uniref:hypothetical protein n=1 Tax=Streptomyces chartreusis TaxID=1969 RepID=UPI003648D35C
MAQATEAPASTTAEGPTSHTLNQPANTFGYTRQEQIEALHKLREPFAATEIRHLPRVWCGRCKDAPRGQSCQNHPLTKCGKCKQKMPNGGHIDLAYVGHAEATNRLLNVDPFWDWEPVAMDERGLPQPDGYRGLWIRLTVCGMTRLGYGHAGDKTGGDAIKEVIGDAIRNAGMRFGMALDLWTTSDLEIIESGEQPDAKQESGTGRPRPAQEDDAKQDEDPLPRLMAQYQDERVWENPLALEQIRLEGKKLEVSARSVQGPPPDNAWTTFDLLLTTRINELKAAKGGDTGRSAA